MKYDPSKIPDDLVLRAAMSMHGMHAIDYLVDESWNNLDENKQTFWKRLAKAALIAVSIHMDSWPEFKERMIKHD